ncbi:hypothetical protein JZ751_018059 [Albula glossodonta]|uniref:Uncharacterized protein n=1 Tax=Albula glossodonta TaxID=121402 RepID=A0A8T2PQ18_9TELE|nr:hypothetical protein JZ751_018059 [Albula glossodonta]
MKKAALFGLNWLLVGQQGSPWHDIPPHPHPPLPALQLPAHASYTGHPATHKIHLGKCDDRSGGNTRQVIRRAHERLLKTFGGFLHSSVGIESPLLGHVATCEKDSSLGPHMRKLSSADDDDGGNDDDGNHNCDDDDNLPAARSGVTAWDSTYVNANLDLRHRIYLPRCSERDKHLSVSGEGKAPYYTRKSNLTGKTRGCRIALRREPRRRKPFTSVCEMQRRTGTDQRGASVSSRGRLQERPTPLARSRKVPRPIAKYGDWRSMRRLPPDVTAQ